MVSRSGGLGTSAACLSVILGVHSALWPWTPARSPTVLTWPGTGFPSLSVKFHLTHLDFGTQKIFEHFLCMVQS